MLNLIWLGLMLLAVIIGGLNHRLDDVVASVMSSASAACSLAIGLIGIMSFWLGLMKIAEAGGLIRILSRCLQPVTRWLFPSIPKNHPAMQAILLNFSANMFGLANAATPFGLKAMQELEKINPEPGKASDAMCLFIAINTSSIQLIPATAIAILSLHGDHRATTIIIPTLIATSISTLVAIAAAKGFARWSRSRSTHPEDSAHALTEQPE